MAKTSEADHPAPVLPVLRGARSGPKSLARTRRCNNGGLHSLFYDGIIVVWLAYNPGWRVDWKQVYFERRHHEGLGDAVLIWLLRVVLYIQLLLGTSRFAGLVTNQRIWETHISLGVAIVILTLIVFRPLPTVPDDVVRRVARFVPLLALAMGLAMLFDIASGLTVVILHMVVGLATVASIEVAAARQRRAQSLGSTAGESEE